MIHKYETIIVGSGGSGLYAALEASQRSQTAVLSKLFPIRSHTGAAQGGISAALGNVEEDKPEWHAFDTVKGGDYLVDQQAVVDQIHNLLERYQKVRVQDTGRAFNTDLLELIELRNLLDLSLLTAASALNRQESRGAHSREDFPDRDDDNWLKHTLAYLDRDSVRIEYKTVDTSIWEPKPRTY